MRLTVAALVVVVVTVLLGSVRTNAQSEECVTELDKRILHYDLVETQIKIQQKISDLEQVYVAVDEGALHLDDATCGATLAKTLDTETLRACVDDLVEGTLDPLLAALSS
ncbi:hypothetical protein QOT17_009536 [Balamuthia mandrillaris]